MNSVFTNIHVLHITYTVKYWWLTVMLYSVNILEKYLFMHLSYPTYTQKNTPSFVELTFNIFAAVCAG